MNKDDIVVKGEMISLRILKPEDVSDNYVRWMHYKDVVRFLENRWSVHTLESIREYVRIINESPDDFLFGIYLKNKKHIGNIKIGNINQIHKFADIGLLIGDKGMWGKGYGSEAIKMATHSAFENLRLNKLV